MVVVQQGVWTPKHQAAGTGNVAGQGRGSDFSLLSNVSYSHSGSCHH
jgi:hypothetical protein